MTTEWSKYEKLVLSELRRLNDNIENLSEKTAQLDKDISIIKVKSTILATISASIVSLVTIFIETLRRH